MDRENVQVFLCNYNLQYYYRSEKYCLAEKLLLYVYILLLKLAACPCYMLAQEFFGGISPVTLHCIENHLVFFVDLFHIFY